MCTSAPPRAGASAPPRLGLDLDEERGVHEPGDDDEGRGRPDVAEPPTVSLGDRRDVRGVDDVHPGPDDVEQGEAGRLEGRRDDAEDRVGLVPGPGMAGGPSGPASVVPATKQASPATIARL